MRGSSFHRWLLRLSDHRRIRERCGLRGGAAAGSPGAAPAAGPGFVARGWVCLRRRWCVEGQGL